MQLHREGVVEGALALLDADGLDGLTMRKLAARLGVQAGAIYWHFENKQALLEAMADRLVEGVGAPLPNGTWDQQLATIAQRLRQALLSHRDGARVMAGTYVAEPNTRLATKVTINILRSAGFRPEQAGWITFALTHYVLGHTIEEQALASLLAEGGWEPKTLAYDEDDDPGFAQAITAVVASNPEERFAYGIQLFLDGLRYHGGDRVPVASESATAVASRGSNNPTSRRNRSRR